MRHTTPFEASVLFWDIDGTLLTTGRAGIFAWEEAVRQVSGEEIDLAAFTTSGLTDVQIAQRLADIHGTGSVRESRRMVRIYEEHLPASLPRRQGQVLPGVREILQYLDRHDHVVSMLLTGNTRAGARAKLRHFSLDRYFTHGAFGDESADRTAVAVAALTLARRVVGDGLPSERTYVIGDTPHDIACGKAIGARTVAVATGSYTLPDLQLERPWLALDRLPSPERFLELLDLGVPSKDRADGGRAGSPL